VIKGKMERIQNNRNMMRCMKKFSAGNSPRMRPLGKCKCKWKDGAKVHPREIRF
jgi:hypothetical protein